MNKLEKLIREKNTKIQKIHSLLIKYNKKKQQKTIKKNKKITRNKNKPLLIKN